MKLLQVATLSDHRCLILSLVTISAVSGSSLFVPSNHALTATTNFVCAKSDSKPVTVAKTKN